MDVVEQFRKIEAVHFLMSIIGFVGGLSPGLLTLFIYKRELFISLDIFKFILLSASLSFPIILFNYFVASSVPSSDKKKDAPMAASLAMALLISTAVFFLPLLVAYLCKFSLHTYIWSVLIFEIVMALFIAIMAIRERAKLEKAS